MKIKIKLANGLEFAGNLTAEQLQKAEASRQFKTADKKGFKCSWCDAWRERGCEYCRHQERCKKQAEKKIDAMSVYINYLSSLN